MTKDEAFAKLARSKFRGRFKMTADDLAYVGRVGLETIRRHAEDFVREKLGPAASDLQGYARLRDVLPGLHGEVGMRRRKRSFRRGGRRRRSRSDAQAPAHVKRGVLLTDAQKAKAGDFLMAWVERRMSAS